MYNWSPKTREEKGVEAVFEEIIIENIPRTSRSLMNLKQGKSKRNHTYSYLTQNLKIKDKEKKF